VAAADAEIGCREGQAHGCLAEIKLGAAELVIAGRADDRDRRGRAGYVMGAAKHLR